MTDSHEPEPTGPLARTPLYDLHARRGARMVPFAGYEMPVQYPTGILAEHAQTRNAAGLFDVSHMGQAFLLGADHETVAQALETLVPADIVSLAPGRQRYTQLLNAEGGILDDLMVARSSDPAENGALMLVVNAARKEADFAHLSAHLPAAVKLMRADHRGLIALQGPKAAEVLAHHVPGIDAMPFMAVETVRFAGIECHVSRSGYTGEDGFELSVNARRIVAVAERLLDSPDVKPVGLGARDSLRLEAGLCLYGHDIDETTTPVEADLVWSIQKRRRTEGGFPGAARIQRELAEGTERVRVGILPEGRVPVREGCEICASDGSVIGRVTSGGFGPTVEKPIAMGYVGRRFSQPGTPILLAVRGREIVAQVAPLPFVPHRYHRAQAAPAPAPAGDS
ncbi:MAG: glycine cleavage system aminomethyltransferase GcvT [Rhizobiales bacterium]|nr:glycine cleavage system aminomethyltransferase GcvT [Hyphomicrobiales bacterium]